MTKYRKKPVVIEAWLNTDENEWPAWLDHADAGREHGGVILIATLEGVMRAQPGDWIIRGVNGEVYPCKPDIFAKTYEDATEEDDPVWLPGLPNISPGNLPRISSDAQWVHIDDHKTITAIPRDQFFAFIQPLMAKDDPA